MNIDNDYDSEGNNIVPCPICLSAHCPSKEGGKCPEEDEFIKDMKTFYIPSISGRPIQSLFEKGWRVSCAGNFFGICLIKYTK